MVGTLGESIKLGLRDVESFIDVSPVKRRCVVCLCISWLVFEIKILTSCIRIHILAVLAVTHCKDASYVIRILFSSNYKVTHYF